MRSYFIQSAIIACMGTVCLSQPTGAYAQSTETVAVVALIGGDGAARTESDDLITMEDLLLDPQEFSTGQGLRTFAEGTAIVLLTQSDTAIFLEHSSEVRFADAPDPTSGVNFIIEVVEGKVSVIQKSENETWLAVAALARPRGAYVLSRGAAQLISLEDEQPSIMCQQGELSFFPGRVPGTPLVDDNGDVAGIPVATIRSGERFDIGIDNARAVRIDAPPPSADVGHDVYAFALAESGAWLGRAEQGDFTPVRGAGRGAPEPLSAQLDSDLAFDQPRPVLTSPAPPNVSPAIRGAISPSQALVDSGSPGTVVAGQRFRRSRILGNPGTTGTGRLTVNGAVEQLIRLR